MRIPLLLASDDFAVQLGLLLLWTGGVATVSFLVALRLIRKPRILEDKTQSERQGPTYGQVLLAFLITTVFSFGACIGTIRVWG